MHGSHLSYERLAARSWSQDQRTGARKETGSQSLLLDWEQVFDSVSLPSVQNGLRVGIKKLVGFRVMSLLCFAALQSFVFSLRFVATHLMTLKKGKCSLKSAITADAHPKPLRPHRPLAVRCLGSSTTVFRTRGISGQLAGQARRLFGICPEGTACCSHGCKPVDECSNTIAKPRRGDRN